MRKVENLVEEFQSESADSLAVCKYSRTVAEDCSDKARSVIPKMALMGVRSSWLMLARN